MNMTTKQHVSMAVSICGLLGVVWGGYVVVDDRYARAAELTQLEQRVLMNELQQAYRDARAEVYFLRDQARKYPDDRDIHRQRADAEAELQRLERLVNE